MKLKTRLLIPAGVGLVATIAVGVTAVVAMHRIGAMLQSSTDHELAAYTAALRTKASLGELHAYAYRQVTLAGSLSPDQIKDARASIARQGDELKSRLAAMQESSQGGTGNALQETLADLDKYEHFADQAVDMATIDANTGVAQMQSADEIFHKNAERLDALVSRQQSALQDAFSSIGTTRAQMAAIATFVTLAAIVATLLLTWRSVGHITSGIQQCSGVADRVARGELSGRIGSSSIDEMGVLLGTLAQMQRSLRDVVGQVRNGIDSMAMATREIAQGNDDLSRRTEHQAASLDATSTSMAKVTSALQRSAEHAQQANTLVSNASEVAARGGAVVGEVVKQMNEIQSSSRKIAEIISVIDGIAFQTNILALNAAVEAARAGEQGRGFAVVAAEVRSLAQRSATAAREIKGLISHSVHTVESGSRLVNDAGETMTQIVDQVRRVTTLIAEIFAATQIQNADIGLVNDSVGKLDNLTQQNAALAEQSAAAAQTLRSQAEHLAQAVSVFSIGQEA